MTLESHPRYDELGRLVDEEGDAEGLAELREHLRECPRCQRELAFLTDLKETARQLAEPRPPRGQLDEILLRRSSGERVILPNAPPAGDDVRPSWRSGPILGAVLVAMIGIAVFVVGSRDASAGAGTLRLTPAEPALGAPVSVEFRAATSLAREERVRLRGRYRTEGMAPPRGSLGTPFRRELGRDGGRFAGRVRLPPSAVYAAFSVEDLPGRRVADNGGLLWELLARDDAGTPLYGALRQKYRVEEKRRPEAALATARTMTSLYPDRAEGWWYRLVMELRITSESVRRDSLLEAHRTELRRLQRRVREETEPPASELAGLAEYARLLGEDESRDRWGRRLASLDPDHPLVVRERVVAALRAHRADPRGLLSALEEEWSRSGPVSELLVRQGLQLAVRLEDGAAAVRWADRDALLRPEEVSWRARQLATLPELRDEALRRLREALASLEDSGPDVRPLDRSVPEARRHARTESRRLLAILGQHLAREGRTSAALDTLRLAEAGEWRPDVLLRIARARLAAGDTAGARTTFSRLKADPLEGAAYADSARRLLGVDPGPGPAAEISGRILAHTRPRTLGPGVTVRDAAGADRSLEKIAGEAGEGVSLVVLWTPRSFWSLRALDRLSAMRDALRAAGVGIVLVSRDATAAEAEGELHRRDLGLPLYRDSGDELAEVLDGWRTPQYAVLDRGSTLHRFAFDLERALRAALLLAEEPDARPQ